MTNKRSWLGILVIVLVFGVTVVGCDDGSNSNPFEGTWTGIVDGENIRVVITSSTFSVTFIDFPSEGVLMTGTYTYTGNTATATVEFDGDVVSGSATVNGNSMTVTLQGFGTFTLTK